MFVFKFLQRDQDYSVDPVTGFSNAFIQRSKSFNNRSDLVNWLLKTNVRVVDKKEDAIAYELVFVSINEYESILMNTYESMQEFNEVFAIT